ncbi:MAG: hypothetical protein P8Y70_00960 [Candidatus Lokiarchaeota archaeon]
MEEYSTLIHIAKNKIKYPGFNDIMGGFNFFQGESNIHVSFLVRDKLYNYFDNRHRQGVYQFSGFDLNSYLINLLHPDIWPQD